MKCFVHRMALIFLTVLFLSAMSVSFWAPYQEREQHIEAQLQPPSWQHWFGTDVLGRDLFTRVFYGARVSLSLGTVTAFLALGLGLLVGLLAGYFGGWVDLFLMKCVDFLYIFPAVLFAILWMLFFGKDFWSLVFALSLSSWGVQARMIRTHVMQLKTQGFVESAEALGASQWRILTKHLLPNVLGPAFVMVGIQIPHNMMAESFLSFIGLGLEPSQASWGILMQDGFQAMEHFPHLIFFPSVFLFCTLFCFNEVSDQMRKKSRALFKETY